MITACLLVTIDNLEYPEYSQMKIARIKHDEEYPGMPDCLLRDSGRTSFLSTLKALNQQ